MAISIRIWSCNSQFIFNFVIYFLIQKDANHPDWATGRPSGSPVAKLMIFDLFFASLRFKLKCMIWKNVFWYLNMTRNFHYNHEQISFYPKVRSPPSSKRYLGLFAKTYNTSGGLCGAPLWKSRKTYLEIHVGKVARSKPLRSTIIISTAFQIGPKINQGKF